MPPKRRSTARGGGTAGTRSKDEKEKQDSSSSPTREKRNVGGRKSAAAAEKEKKIPAKQQKGKSSRECDSLKGTSVKEPSSSSRSRRKGGSTSESEKEEKVVEPQEPPKKPSKKSGPRASREVLALGPKRKIDDEEEAEPGPSDNVDYQALYGANAVPLKDLNVHITCGLCKGYLIDATTVIECLHSFCKSCLLKYFDEEDFCCPKCGQLIHQSHPTHYIAYDRTLQDIVYKVVPGLFETERLQRVAFLREKRRLAGDDLEAEDRLQEQKRKEAAEDKTNRCFKGKPMATHHRDDEQMIVRLVRGSSDFPKPDKPVVRVSEMATVNTLKRYLSYSMWGTKERYKEVDLFYNNELMGRDYSVKFIKVTRCRELSKEKPLNLVFKHRVH